MAFALSFAPEFFWGDGSVSHENVKPSRRPTSVYQALLSLSDHEWATLARDVFQMEPEHLDPDMVIDKVQETNTCRNLDSPVDVFIDPEGWYTLLIYERRKE